MRKQCSRLVLCLLALLIFEYFPYKNSYAGHINEDFARGLSKFGQRNRVFVVAEGRPLPSDGKGAEAKSILDSRVDVKEKARQLADLHDYNMEPTEGGFLFVKRYTTTEDLPAVTFEEVEASVNDILRIVQRLNPLPKPPRGIDNGSLQVHHILRALTPEQSRQVTSEGLRVATLTVEQRTHMANACAFAYVEPVRGTCQEVGGRLAKANKAFLVAEPPRERFGIRLPHPHYGSVFEAIGDGMAARHFPASIAPTSKENLDAWGDAETIADVVARLNKRGGTGMGGMFDVSPLLKDKPITVRGDENAPPTRVFRAIARLYDLKVERRAGRILLLRKGIPANLSLTTLQSALLAVFPRPLRNAMSSGMTPEWDGKSVPTREQVMSPRRRWRDEEIALGAIRWLRAAQEEPAKKVRKEGIAVSSLPPRDRAALALILGRKFLSGVSNRLQFGPPPYVTRMDEILLRARRYDDRQEIGKVQPKLFFEMLLWDAQANRWKQLMGFGHVANTPFPHERR